MEILYSDQYLGVKQPSIFLAGPTPRDPKVKSWRLEALKILQDLYYTGQVLVPERKDWANFDYIEQVEWEYAALDQATIIVFWVPRDLKTLPGFTTNVEFGKWVTSGKILYGRPDDSPNNRYLDWLYKKEANLTPNNGLWSLLDDAVYFASKGIKIQ